MEVRYVGKSVTLDDPPVKYFVVWRVPFYGDIHVVSFDNKTEAGKAYQRPDYDNGVPVAIIKGYVIEGSLE